MQPYRTQQVYIVCAACRAVELKTIRSNAEEEEEEEPVNMAYGLYVGLGEEYGRDTINRLCTLISNSGHGPSWFHRLDADWAPVGAHVSRGAVSRGQLIDPFAGIRLQRMLLPCPTHPAWAG